MSEPAFDRDIPGVTLRCNYCGEVDCDENHDADADICDDDEPLRWDYNS